VERQKLDFLSLPSFSGLDLEGVESLHITGLQPYPIFSAPAIYGWRTSGISTLPSALLAVLKHSHNSPADSKPQAIEGMNELRALSRHEADSRGDKRCSTRTLCWEECM